MSRRTEVLRLERITTESRGVRILTDARLNLFSGEIVGLLGVNHSGKTALAGAICGFAPCSGGDIYFMEQRVTISSITQVWDLGIFYLQKKSSLVEDITVFDNFMLSSSSHHILIGNRKRREAEIREVLSIFDAGDIDSSAGTDTLTEYEHLLVEVCKAVLNGVKVIVFDSVLSGVSLNIENKVNRILARLSRMNICVILIEAKYKYLEPWCDRFFLMRSGRTVGIFDRCTEEDKIISLMMGYPVKSLEESPKYSGGSNGKKELLVLDQICTDKGLSRLSFTAYEGEITGILCLERTSLKALVRFLEGRERRYEGKILYEGKRFRNRGTDEALRKGIVFIREDNLFPEMSFEENLLISAYQTTSRGPFLNTSELKYTMTELESGYFSEYENLYKKTVDSQEDWLFRKRIMLCRGLAASPRLMICVNPAVHSDFVLRNSYYEDLLSIKKMGISGLILSTDLEELLALCDRILILQNGCITEQYQVDQAGSSALKHKFSAFLKDIQD